MEEKVDVLLATYNGERYISEQIESILNQTYKNINLIISDDCSKDNTPEIIREYAQKDERIKVYLQEKNLGVVKNIEFLLKQVQSSLYMLSDQDDVWLSVKIEKSVETLKKQDADLVFGDLEVVDKNLKTIYTSFGDFMLLNRKIGKYIKSYKMNYLYNCITGCTVLSKKKFIEKILPLPEKTKFLIHDHWIGLMVALDGKLAYMPEKYIKYRQHGNNQIGTNKVSHGFSEFSQVRQHFIDVKLGIFETYVENNSRFPNVVQKLNREALEYYRIVNKTNNFNFRKWNIYHELYKTENIDYYIMNFIIMNLPFIGRPVFKIRYAILRFFKKR